MKRIATALAALLTALLLVISSGVAVASPTTSAPRHNLPVLAYYYQWFSSTSWNRAKTDYPLAGRYSSDDVSIMRRHVVQAQQAGISGFIVSWKHSSVNDRRLRALMRVANETNFKLAIIYQGLNFHRHPLPVERVADDLDLFNSQFATDPAFKIFDKPLVIWSGTWKFSAADLERTTAPLRSSLTMLATEKSPEGYERVARGFDGDAYYWSSVDPTLHPGHAAKLKAMSRTVHRAGGLWIAPFAPGFDARLLDGTREVPRRNGDTLRAEYAAALSSSPDALGLISWNEFSENTHVEPSVKYGDSSLAAVARLSEGGHVSLSPVAEDSSEQSNGNPNSMTVSGGIVVLLILLACLTAVALVRRPRAPRADQGSPSENDRRTVGRRFLAPRVLIATALILLVALALAYVIRRNAVPDVTSATPLYLGEQTVQNPQHVVIGAAGDISCPVERGRLGEPITSNSCKMQQTADLLGAVGPDAVLALGDNQYPDGSLRDFKASYDRTWGEFREITYPVPGNHEYGTPGAEGYFSYFGSRAGEPDKGYYSYDLGSWHLVALNSECQQIGGCSDTSPQATWLKQDLRAHPRACTLAYWHRPRFSSGSHGNNLDNDALWRIVTSENVDLVLHGHDHDYERFAPMDGEGNAASATGTTVIVVGTGGASHYKFRLPSATSLVRVRGENGILRLELTEQGYSWQFLRSPDEKILDSGSSTCH